MVKLTDVTGIGPITAKLLSEHNIKTVEALASISLIELQKLPGFSEIRARTIKKAASDCLKGKAGKQLLTVAHNVQTAIKKAKTNKIMASQAATQAETDQDKNSNKKNAKNKEKLKDKNKKKKNKNKNKDKDKDKNKKKNSKKKEKDKKK